MYRLGLTATAYFLLLLKRFCFQFQYFDPPFQFGYQGMEFLRVGGTAGDSKYACDWVYIANYVQLDTLGYTYVYVTGSGKRSLIRTHDQFVHDVRRFFGYVI